MTDFSDSPRDLSKLLALSLGALGVVYGDIGTSPLYALRECFYGADHLPLNHDNVLGVLSLIFWSLIIVISVKYQLVVMRADNRGEGGILALLALLDPWHGSVGRRAGTLIFLGVFGAALLYGDGVITPAISVLSAVEGLEVAAPALQHFVIPITLGILIALFVGQRHGTGRVGAVFGPVMLVWFVTIGLLGSLSIWRHPRVLAGLDPRYGLELFANNRLAGFLVLGAVFLVATGGEALYADMGHFGRRPIRLAWFSLALPALLLNYFGQGALMLSNPVQSLHPFYNLAPDWALLPLVGLATVATVIASQAVISGAFSLMGQAVQLGQTPRMNIIQTSSEEVGQIYIPTLNWMLMLGTIALVIGFRSSSALAAAYGVAVSTTMVITTMLTYFVILKRWRWPAPVAVLVTLLFLVVDLAFFGANLFKIADGGWLPLAAGGLVFLIMSTWSRGRQNLIDALVRHTEPLDSLLGRITDKWPVRVPGTAVFMTAPNLGVPPMLQHHIEHNQVLHERVILLTVITEEVPWISGAQRVDAEELGHGFWRIHIRYGFMQSPNVPLALRLCERVGLSIDPNKATFYLGRETLLPTDARHRMAAWREKLFHFMRRNAVRATDFYRIPPQRVVEFGIRLKISATAKLSPTTSGGNSETEASI